MVDPRGITTTTTYNAGGNPLTVSYPVTDTGVLAVTHFAYDPTHPGDVLTITNTIGNQWHYSYDGNGYVIRATNPLNESTLHSYDSLGRVLVTTSPRGLTTTFQYNAYGDQTRTTNTAGGVTLYTYDRNRNVLSIQDPTNAITHYTYNLANLQTGILRPNGSHTTYTYNPTRNLIGQINDTCGSFSYDYDSSNRLIRVADASGTTTYNSYTYYADNSLQTVVDAAARTTTYTYYPDGQLHTTDYSDSNTPDVTFNYYTSGTSTGLLSDMIDGTGTTHYMWYASASKDLLRSVMNGAGKQVTYGYNASAQVTSILYPSYLSGTGPQVKYTYDGAGNMTSMSDGIGIDPGYTTNFTQDSDQNLVRTDYNYPIGASIDVNPGSSPKLPYSIDHTFKDSTYLSLQYSQYMNSAGVNGGTNEDDPTDPNGTLSTSYYYNGSWDQLTGAQLSHGTPNDYTWTYGNCYEIDSTISGNTNTSRTHDTASASLTHLDEYLDPSHVHTKNIDFTYEPTGNRTSQVDDTRRSDDLLYLRSGKQANRLQ